MHIELDCLIHQLVNVDLCGVLDRESADHFLLCCTRYQEARKQLTDSVLSWIL